MKLILIRNLFREDGIFGELQDQAGNPIAVTLEHAYPDDVFGFSPKLPQGEYICEKGPHRLAGMDQPFETYEIKGVPGHFGILFHVGNYNEDSEGCVLIGAALGNKSNGGKMIVNSRNTFKKFMEITKGVESFELFVEDFRS